MKKYTITFLISIVGVVFAQEPEQLYTIQRVDEGTELRSGVVGYLNSKFNDACNAPISTNGKNLCAVVKVIILPESPLTAGPYYKIVQGQHGSSLPNFVGWMDDNKTCNLPEGTALAGSPGCAVVRADLPETDSQDNRDN